MTSLPLRNPNPKLPASESLRKAIAARYQENQSSNEAFYALQQLALRFPASLLVRLDLINLAQQRCEFEQTKTTALELLALRDDDPVIINKAADALAAAGEHAAAREAWLEFSKNQEHRAVAYTALAGNALRGNRTEEAEQWIDQALEITPNNGMVQLLGGQIARKAGQFDLAAEYLANCTQPQIPVLIRFRGLYEIGELKDQTGDFAGAVAAWKTAKHCLETDMPAQVEKARNLRQQRLARNQRLLAQLTPQAIKPYLRPAPSRSSALAILGGHPRSGTTLLEQVLAAHPQVADLDEKDVFKASLQANLLHGRLEFFDLETLREASNMQLATVRTDYLRRCSILLGRLSKQTLLLDKNPNNTDVLPMALAALPGLKLLIARRDPRDILLSCFRLQVTPEFANIGWLREQDAVEDYRSMMAVWERLRDCLAGEANWLEVEYAQLCSDLDNTARQVTRFLGLDWHKDQQHYRKVRQQAHINSPNFAEAKAPVHTASLGRWQRYAELLPALFEPFAD
jgi:tetratricopeptide (TPR) repeat protein